MADQAERARFFSQMSMLLECGVPLLQILKILAEDTSSEDMKTALESVHDKVDKGGGLAESMAEFDTLFPSPITSMVKAAELAGDVSLTSRRIAIMLRRIKEEKASLQDDQFAYFNAVSQMLLAKVPLVQALSEAKSVITRNELASKIPAAVEKVALGGNFSKAFADIPELMPVPIPILLDYAMQNAMTQDIFSEIADAIRENRIELPAPYRPTLAVEQKHLFSLLYLGGTAGVPLAKLTEHLPRAFSRKEIQGHVREIHERVQAGGHVSDVLQKHPGIYSQPLIVMVKNGELHGIVEKVARSIAEGLARGDFVPKRKD